MKQTRLLARNAYHFDQNDNAFLDVSKMLAIPAIVIGAILTAIIVFALLGGTIGLFASSVKNVSANVSTADWGNPTANTIAPTFGLIISLAGLFAAVSLTFLGVAVYRHFKSR